MKHLTLVQGRGLGNGISRATLKVVDESFNFETSRQALRDKAYSLGLTIDAERQAFTDKLTLKQLVKIQAAQGYEAKLKACPKRLRAQFEAIEGLRLEWVKVRAEYDALLDKAS